MFTHVRFYQGTFYFHRCIICTVFSQGLGHLCAYCMCHPEMSWGMIRAGLEAAVRVEVELPCPTTRQWLRRHPAIAWRDYPCLCSFASWTFVLTLTSREDVSSCLQPSLLTSQVIWYNLTCYWRNYVFTATSIVEV